MPGGLGSGSQRRRVALPLGLGLALGLWLLGVGRWGRGVAHQLTQELELGQEELPHHIPAKKHEEQCADQRSHDDQQSEPYALPHFYTFKGISQQKYTILSLPLLN